MNFSGITFLCLFLPIFFLLYYTLPKRAENYLLVIGSILFYSWGEPIFIIFFLMLTMANFFIGILFDQFSYTKSNRIVIFVVGVSLNCISFIFGGSIPFIAGLMENMGITSSFLTAAPLGFGFYILSCVSYIADIYLNKAPVQRNFIKYMVYVSMFPKLLAGPVVQYSSLEWQIDHRTVTSDKIFSGLVQFVKGLGKKVLIADNIIVLSSKILAQDPSNIAVSTAWLGAIAALFSFYFDFYGYTDMARGLAKMLGFQLPKNFHFPFIASSVHDFFRRWHISFGRWVNTYIYTPLNQLLVKKCVKFSYVISLVVIVSFVVLWHGFGLVFFAAGFFYFIILLCERYLWGKFFKKIPKFFGRFYTLFITLLACALLSYRSLPQSFSYVLSMFGLNRQPFYDNLSIYYFLSYLPLLLISAFLTSGFLRVRANRIKHFYPKLYGWLTPLGCALVFILSMAFVVNSKEIPFLSLLA